MSRQQCVIVYIRGNIEIHLAMAAQIGGYISDPTRAAETLREAIEKFVQCNELDNMGFYRILDTRHDGLAIQHPVESGPRTALSTLADFMPIAMVSESISYFCTGIHPAAGGQMSACVACVGRDDAVAFARSAATFMAARRGNYRTITGIDPLTRPYNEEKNDR